MMMLSPEQKIHAIALDLVASVSASNLAKRPRNGGLPSTLVDPFLVRELASALEELYPGVIERVRAERQQRIDDNYRRRVS
jgi:hypothetical protein